MSNIATIQKIISRHQRTPGALLPLLHEVQDTLGYIPATAVKAIAAGLNLSRAEVHGVITYYHHFRSSPAGRHVIQVCRAEACRSQGSERLLDEAVQLLNCPLHATRSDASVTLEPVYCLGLCALSPAISIDGKLHGRVSHTKLEQLVDKLETAS